MPRRRLFAPAVAVFAALILASCTPDPGVATPTPTELTEEQAYAAAEDAFRAYIDAQNAVVVDDPSTFEPVYALTTGRQNSFDREQYSTWHAEGWRESGDISVLWINPAPTASSAASVKLTACLDTSEVSLVDSTGESVRPVGGLDVAGWTVVVNRSDEDRWLVEITALPEDAQPCQAR